jgi:hypothetical protein
MLLEIVLGYCILNFLSPFCFYEMSANPFILLMLHSVGSTSQEFLSTLILQELVR